MHKLEDLKIWHKPNDIVLLTYELVKEFPKDELYGLTSQMKRSAISIASNIAEGAGRNPPGEFVQFLGMANGSLYELQAQSILTSKLSFGSKENIEVLLNEINSLQKMIYNLRIRNRKPISKP
ncbi:MAG: four helix bundle protein [Flavobacteriales bacterium]|nr:four helix bundle protein [Flavobacteriales bacterium]